MKGFPSFAAHLVPGLLVIGLVSLGRPCVAQEVDVPKGQWIGLGVRALGLGGS